MASENNVVDTNTVDFRLMRKFLIVGVEGGTYFPGEKAFVREHAACFDRLIADRRGEEVVAEIVRCAREDSVVDRKSLIFALASCARNGVDPKTKSAAYKALPLICTDAKQLFSFIDYCETLSGPTSGWGRGHRNAIGNWYHSFAAEDLARIVTRNIQSGGWSHVDVLRLAHVHPKNDAIGLVLMYIVRGYNVVKKLIESDGLSSDLDALTKFLTDVHTLKHSHDEHQVACLITEHKFSLEFIPTWMSRSKEVWLSLIRIMPISDMVRLLGRMSSIGLLEPLSDASKAVIERLKDENAIQREKLQPFDLLIAMKTYESGKGDKGRMKWAPNCNVLDAVTKAFYNSIKVLKPTNQRYLLAVDVSGSMAYGSVNGCHALSPAVTAAALSMTIARTEKDYQMVAFSTGITPVKLTPEMDLLDVCKEIAEIPTGGTDCALPILWAMEQKKSVDVFIVLTDCETLAGQIHPVQALQQYRHILNIQNSKLIICALTSGGFTIADPMDHGMLDVAGFDIGAAKVIRSFIERNH
ncbi:RNA-binding protein RO60-like [Tubulanus polymorphus]|uniref:RNA-binding protein RO60-like n=1 Tax=Tubulanus polymorphus TaxID=672921 RepID=UPI003DA20917